MDRQRAGGSSEPTPGSSSRYTELEIHQARVALATRGYPNPTMADIEHVLQYAYQQPHETPEGRHPKSSWSHSEPISTAAPQTAPQGGGSPPPLWRRSMPSTSAGERQRSRGSQSPPPPGAGVSQASSVLTTSVPPADSKSPGVVSSSNSRPVGSTARNVTLTVPEGVGGGPAQRPSRTTTATTTRTRTSAGSGSRPAVGPLQHRGGRESGTRSVLSRRPGWDDSTRNTAAAMVINGPHFPPSGDPKVPPMANAGISRFAGDRKAATLSGEPARRGPSRTALAAESPAVHLRPTVRLERYMKRFEKALGQLYMEHPLLAPEGSPYREGATTEDWHSARLELDRSPVPRPPPGHPDSMRSPTDDEETEGAIRHMMLGGSSPTKKQPKAHPCTQIDRRYEAGEERAESEEAETGHEVYSARGNPRAALEMPLRVNRHPYLSAASARRDANVIFSITGDPRYRYRHSAAAVSPSPRSVYTAASRSPPPRGTANRRDGRDVSCPPSFATSCFVDPTGCTLRRKADPVRRGEQMRTLWERDAFLTNALPGTLAWQRKLLQRQLGVDSSAAGVHPPR